MLVLIFLSAFAIASHQEFQVQLERPMHWFPYRRPSQDLLRQRYPFQANLFRHNNPFTDHSTPVGVPQSRNKINLMKEFPEGNDPDAQLRYHSNYYWKTATYTMTSTVNVTSVHSCIPLNMFAVGSHSVVCSRKKRGIMQDPTGIDPSEPQKVTMTTVPVVDQLERGNGHLVYDRDLISSSKDDAVVREKRIFFHNWVSFTTVPSYYINNFVVTKRVNLVGNNQLFCRPSDYPVCM